MKTSAQQPLAGAPMETKAAASAGTANGARLGDSGDSGGGGDGDESDAVFTSAAELFRLLSTPMRLRIISALCSHEKNVSQLLAEIDTTQPNMSQHLKPCVPWPTVSTSIVDGP